MLTYWNAHQLVYNATAWFVLADVSICEAPQQVDLPKMRQQVNAVDCSTDPAMQHYTSQPNLKQDHTSKPELKQHHLSQPSSWRSSTPYPYSQHPKADVQQAASAHIRIAAKDVNLHKGRSAEYMVMSGDLGTSQVRLQCEIEGGCLQMWMLAGASCVH